MTVNPDSACVRHTIAKACVRHTIAKKEGVQIALLMPLRGWRLAMKIGKLSPHEGSLNLLG